ncbi:hypothetical protein [Halorubrum sp. BOL3-1]|uniref:hypothetical protein n=1 Tax=Halorubrum sp. BOL3-1 TaxID=2497325 RepID=UPI0019D5699D|nr:hypothetical protein [Halorubrum sp. BOL3-1]
MSPEETVVDDEPDPQIDRETLVDAFDADDPKLAPEEKETTFGVARDEDRVRFFTAEAGVGRRLLAHPAAVLDEVVVEGDGRGRPARDPAEVSEGEHVVGVRGTLPVGALQIKSRPRKSDQHAAIVSERVLDEVDE